MVELIAIVVLAAVASGGWATAIAGRVTLRLYRSALESLQRQSDAYCREAARQAGRADELAARIVEMRKQDFVEPAPLPEPRPPLPAEIEAFIAELPLEMQAEQRAWCYDQLGASVPPAEILAELDSAGDMIEDEIRRSERG